MDPQLLDYYNQKSLYIHKNAVVRRLAITCKKFLIVLFGLSLSSLAVAQTYSIEKGIREAWGFALDLRCSGSAFDQPVSCELTYKEGEKESAKKLTVNVSGVPTFFRGERAVEARNSNPNFLKVA